MKYDFGADSEIRDPQLGEAAGHTANTNKPRQGD